MAAGLGAVLGLALLATGVPSGPAGAAPTFKNDVYAGELTATHAPFFFTTSRNGRTITRLLTTGSGSCQPTSSQPLPPQLQEKQSFLVAPTNIAVGRSGTFHATKTHRSPSSTATATIRGSFTPSRVSGTIEDRETPSQNGTQIATCDSGPMRFTARGIGAFAGTTSQRGPVDVNFTTNIKKVRTFQIAWLVPHCASGQGFSGIDYDNNVGVKGGTFHDSGSITTPQSSGGSKVEDLSMAGRFVSGHEVKGTFRDRVTLEGPRRIDPEHL